ncbi:TetR/AcrR family transcriptional regulator [Pseudolabrys sp. FHR47]|uniref:TetR/AcrR family transcriptional regulator n=1 Tax=Pseudolabrys sp. FHR47 TaxID=2562284 RepID=UPI0010BF2239|nr:TetR/AcrR family transcriptional regulator [Pseudolabrys sp. FHR47]
MAMQQLQDGDSLEGQRATPDRSNLKVASILAAARELFIDQGFDAVSMDMVSRQANVSKATLYAHFTSKEALFTAVMVDEANRVADEIWRLTLDKDDVAHVLRLVATNFVEIFLTEQAMLLLRTVAGVVPRLPSVGTAIFESGPKVIKERLAQFLIKAHESGQLNVPDPALAAIQFLSLVRGDFDIRGMLVPSSPPSRAEVDAQIEAGIELFLGRYSPVRSPG